MQINYHKSGRIWLCVFEETHGGAGEEKRDKWRKNCMQKLLIKFLFSFSSPPSHRFHFSDSISISLYLFLSFSFIHVCQRCFIHFWHWFNTLYCREGTAKRQKQVWMSVIISFSSADNFRKWPKENELNICVFHIHALALLQKEKWRREKSPVRKDEKFSAINNRNENEKFVIKSFEAESRNEKLKKGREGFRWGKSALDNSRMKGNFFHFMMSFFFLIAFGAQVVYLVCFWFDGIFFLSSDEENEVKLMTNAKESIKNQFKSLKNKFSIKTSRKIWLCRIDKENFPKSLDFNRRNRFYFCFDCSA